MTEELNLPCLYKVQKDHITNAYCFSTTSGACYEVLFIESKLIFMNTELEWLEVNEIAINKVKAGTGRKDPEIVRTIESILHHFFLQKNRVLIYTCDGNDARQMSRKRMFDIWYSTRNEKGVIQKYNKEIDHSEEQTTYYAGVVFHIDNAAGSEKIKTTVDSISNELSK